MSSRPSATNKNQKAQKLNISSGAFFLWFSLIFLFLLFFYSVREILFPFIIGILFGYLLDPLVDKLEKKISRSIAAGLITISFFLILTFLVSLFLPTLIDQTQNFLKNIPKYVEKTRELVAPYLEKIMLYLNDGDGDASVKDSVKEKAQSFLTDNSGQIINIMIDFLNRILLSSASIVNSLSLLFVTPIVTFYMLKDWHGFTENIKKAIPTKYKRSSLDLLGRIDQTLSGFLRGQANVCMALAVFYSVALTIFGLDFALLIGIATGVLSFMPYVGFAIGFVSALIMTIFQFGDILHIVIMLVIFAVGQILEGYIFVPKLVGNKVNLHPVWIIFAVFAGGTLFGFTGILIALPAAAVIGVVIRYAFEQFREKKLVE